VGKRAYNFNVGTAPARVGPPYEYDYD